MAAISTYTELGTAFSKWSLGRDMSADFDECLDLAEAYFNTKLRCRQMETVDDLTPTLKVCTLPTDYLEYKRVVELASIRRRLDYLTEDAADEMYPSRASGLACNFIIVGDNLTALPMSSNDIELTYYAKVPALTGAANWLLSAHPGLYLHGCLLYGALLNQFDDEVAKQTVIVERFIDNIHALDNRAKFASAGVTFRGPVP